MYSYLSKVGTIQYRKIKNKLEQVNKSVGLPKRNKCTTEEKRHYRHGINRLRGTCWLPLSLQDLENSDTEERQSFEEQTTKVMLGLMESQALKESVSGHSPAANNGGEKSRLFQETECIKTEISCQDKIIMNINSADNQEEMQGHKLLCRATCYKCGSIFSQNRGKTVNR